MEIARYGGVIRNGADIVITFVRMAIAGPIIGVVALMWIQHVFNDPLVEISISITTAYLSFYISEFWVKSSGVLTVVFVGLMFSARGRTCVSPEVFHFLHEF